MTRIAAPFQAPVLPALPPGAAASAILADLPPALRDLAQGAFLSGTVLDRNGNSGLTLLLTSSGVIGLKTTTPLPAGSTVTLQVQSAGAQMQAIVLSVTPQPSSTGTPTPPAPASAQAPAPAQAAPATVHGPAGAPSTITATVIGPATTPAPSAPPPAAASPTSNVTLPAPAGTSSGEATEASPAPTAKQPPATPAADVRTERSAPLPPPAPAPTAVAYQQTAVYQKQMASTPLPPSAPNAGMSPSAANGPTQAPSATTPAAPEASSTVPPMTAPSAKAAAPGFTPPMATGSPAPSPPAPLPSGTQIQVRLVAVEGTEQTSPEPAPAPNAATPPSARAEPAANAAPSMPRTSASAGPATASLDATLTARTPAGQTVVDTPVGRLLLTLPKTLEAAPLGARLRFEMLPADKPGVSAPVVTPSGPSVLAREWPALKEALRAAQDTPDPDVHAALDRALPKAGPRLAQQMMAFIETASQGGSKSWLGDVVSRALERLPGGLVGRLDHDLRDMLATPRGPDSNWHLTIVPFLDGRDLRQIRFFERRKKNDGTARRREDPARFVIECDHSELGAMQIDGLMHEQRLDMILRTHDALPTDMERDILVLFDQACVGLRVHGQLSFQAVANFPVSPIDEFGDAAVQVSA